MTPEKSISETEIAATTAGQNSSARRWRISRGKVKNGMFDAPEIVAVGVAGAALLGVILAYFFMLLPAREDYRKSEIARVETQKKLLDLEEKAALTRTKASGAGDLMASFERFETIHLPASVQGNAALYQRLNDLIRSNGLRNTAGPEYSPLEIVDASRESRSKSQSLFPGTLVTVTVEGSYANLRRFIGDLENTRQFLVINAIEIESNIEGGGSSTAGDIEPPRPVQPAPNNFPNPAQPNSVNPRAPAGTIPPNVQTQPQPQPRPAQTGSKRGAVSLRLEMAAYFRRTQTQ